MTGGFPLTVHLYFKGIPAVKSTSSKTELVNQHGKAGHKAGLAG